MRYSLRWLLAAMAYVALVGGAVVSGSTFMADVVWALTFTTFCYAVVTAFFGKGIRRAIQRESEIARNYRSGKTATAHRDLLTTIRKCSRILTNYSRNTEQVRVVAAAHGRVGEVHAIGRCGS